MRKIHILTAVYFTIGLLFLFTCSGFGGGKESYQCHYCKGIEPVLDGKIDKDQFWKSVPASSDFLVYRKNVAAAKRTYFKIMYHLVVCFLELYD